MKTRVVQDGPPPQTDRTPDRGPLGLVRRHPVATFFLLSYAIAWPLVPWGSFIAGSPLIAALILIPIVDGKAGYKRLGRRLIRWRVGWQWWLAAFAIPLGVLALAVSAADLFGLSHPSFDQFTPLTGVLMVFGLHLVFPLGGPLGEEPGFRGFALPKLLGTRSPLAATALLGLGVAVWHAPLMAQPFGMRPLELVSTFAVTFWYAWLYMRSGGSALITLVAHAAQGTIEHNKLWDTGSEAVRLELAYMVVAVLVAAGLVVFDRRTWLEPAPDELSA